MSIGSDSVLPTLLQRREAELLEAWLAELSSGVRRTGQVKEAELRENCREFLSLLREALAADQGNIEGSGWVPIRNLLQRISRARAIEGFTPTETATFVFSLKKPLFDALLDEVKDGAPLAAEIWNATTLIDRLGLFTTEVHQKTRDEVISR